MKLKLLTAAKCHKLMIMTNAELTYKPTEKPKPENDIIFLPITTNN